MSDAVAWLLGLALASVPVERAKNPPGWEESPELRAQRYEHIAADLAAVAYDPRERPAYDGPQARARTAALMLGVAIMESGLARDVDLGPCFRGSNGTGPRCDRGRAFCLMQVHADGPGRTTREGWTGEELTSDRRKCFRAALHLIRASFHSAAGADPTHRLDAYAGGSIAAHGAGAARLAFGEGLFVRAWRKAPRDSDVLGVEP